MQPSRDRRTELQHPAPHRFVGDVEPSFGQQFLDIAIAQGEEEIQPDRVLDDLGRKAMTAVAERSHADILSDTPLAPDRVSVTMPLEDMWRELEAGDRSPARISAGCALQARRTQLPEMAAAAKPSEQPRTESCVVSGNGRCEA